MVELLSDMQPCSSGYRSLQYILDSVAASTVRDCAAMSRLCIDRLLTRFFFLLEQSEYLTRSLRDRAVVRDFSTPGRSRTHVRGSDSDDGSFRSRGSVV
jgi:hypothetical protein